MIDSQLCLICPRLLLFLLEIPYQALVLDLVILYVVDDLPVENLLFFGVSILEEPDLLLLDLLYQLVSKLDPVYILLNYLIFPSLMSSSSEYYDTSLILYAYGWRSAISANCFILLALAPKSFLAFFLPFESAYYLEGVDFLLLDDDPKPLGRMGY